MLTPSELAYNLFQLLISSLSSIPPKDNKNTTLDYAQIPSERNTHLRI
jgi:hypothetical protein